MTRKGSIDDSAGAFLLDSLDARWKSFSTRLRECHRETRSEEVRRVRVALRRLLSHVEVTQRIYRSKAGQRARRRLKEHLKVLGPLRDLQMEIRYFETLTQKFPEVEGVLRWLRKREKKKLRRTRHELETIKCAGLKRDLRGATSRTRVHLLQCGISASAKQRKALQEFLEKVEARFKELDRQDVESIHRLRVAFKKFRYLVELLRPDAPDLLQKMKAYQGRMGAIQDLDVMIRALQKYTGRQRPQTSRMLGRLRREVRRRRNGAVRDFWRQRRELFQFSPDQKTAGKTAHLRKTR